MIFDVRTYTCAPGRVRAHLDIYREHGMAAQTRHLGPPVLIGVTEIGDVNTYVHVWSYESLADRDEKRRAMRADPAWQDYLRISDAAGYLLRQQNQILDSVL